jgi:hypothetical protein
MRSSKWWGSRAIAVLAVASVALMWAAPDAGAKQINSAQELKKSCAKGNGTFTGVGNPPTSGVCDVQGGYVVCMNNPPKGQPKCHGLRYAARSAVPAEDVRGAHGVVMTTQKVSDSQVWKQNVSVAGLRDVVCTNLGGQFIASPDSAIGTCVTQTATIVCNDTLAGANCLGLAGTKKQADSLSKQAKTAAAGIPSSTAPSSTTPATTTTTKAPTSSAPSPTGTRAPQPSVAGQPPK